LNKVSDSLKIKKGLNKDIENIDQFEACNRIVKYTFENPDHWITPLEIKTHFLSSVPIQKIYYLFDLIVITFPEPAHVERDVSQSYWKIRANEYSKIFLEEGGFNKQNYPNLPQNIIKILFLSASPSDIDRIRVDLELRKIEEQLVSSEFRDQIILEKRTAVKIESITKALLDIKPKIVHFSGHGNEEGILVETEDGSSTILPQEGLKKLFLLFKDTISCVFLNSCYSELQAKTISKQGIYVIGMSNSIEDKAAIEFSKGFYQGIGAGKDIEFSFKLGIIMISNDLENNNIPILWKDGECIVVN